MRTFSVGGVWERLVVFFPWRLVVVGANPICDNITSPPLDTYLHFRKYLPWCIGLAFVTRWRGLTFHSVWSWLSDRRLAMNFMAWSKKSAFLSSVFKSEWQKLLENKMKRMEAIIIIPAASVTRSHNRLIWERPPLRCINKYLRARYIEPSQWFASMNISTRPPPSQNGAFSRLV